VAVAHRYSRPVRFDPRSSAFIRGSPLPLLLSFVVAVSAAIRANPRFPCRSIRGPSAVPSGVRSVVPSADDHL